MHFIEIIKIFFLGIIEGVTEWLPVSSTGHMLLFNALFPLQLEKKFTDVLFYFIQLGAIFAVLILFWKKLFPFKRVDTGTSSSKKLVVDKGVLTLWGKVLVACVPAVIGIAFELPDAPLLIAVALIVYGVAFIVIENANKNKTFAVHSTEDISYKQALIIGLFQLLAIIPGTSRSGATILGALLIGISRPTAAEFTFFLAIPVMAGASAIQILKYLLAYGMFTWGEIGYLLISAAVAFLVSLITVKFLMNFVKKHDFKVFGWYRIVLGAVVIATLVLPTFFA